MMLPGQDALQRWLAHRAEQRLARATADLWAAMDPLRSHFFSSTSSSPALSDEQARQALKGVRRAVRRGADVGTPRRPGSAITTSPLEWSLKHGAWDLAQTLLDLGADPDQPCSEQIRWNHWDVAQPDLLVARTVTVPLRVLAVMEVAKAATDGPSVRGDGRALLDRLVPEGQVLSWADDAGFPLAGQLAQAGDRPAAWPAALWRRLDAQAVDPLGRSALHWMAQKNWTFVHHPQVIGRLIDAGADPAHPDQRGDTPLLLLARTVDDHHLLPVLDALLNSHPDLRWDAVNAQGDGFLTVMEARHPSALLRQRLDLILARTVAREQRTLREALDVTAAGPGREGVVTATVDARPVPGTESRPRRSRL